MSEESCWWILQTSHLLCIRKNWTQMRKGVCLHARLPNFEKHFLKRGLTLNALTNIFGRNFFRTLYEMEKCNPSGLHETFRYTLRSLGIGSCFSFEHGSDNAPRKCRVSSNDISCFPSSIQTVKFWLSCKFGPENLAQALKSKDWLQHLSKRSGASRKASTYLTPHQASLSWLLRWRIKDWKSVWVYPVGRKRVSFENIKRFETHITRLWILWKDWLIFGEVQVCRNAINVFFHVYIFINIYLLPFAAFNSSSDLVWPPFWVCTPVRGASEGFAIPDENMRHNYCFQELRAK